MLDLVQSGRFRRDLKLAIRRGYNIRLLEEVVDTLAQGGTLSLQYRDHPLTGDYGGFRECHHPGLAAHLSNQRSGTHPAAFQDGDAQ